jgi:hypothetical protein
MTRPSAAGENAMSDDRSFLVSNARARERLKALVGRLSEADLERGVGGGWTVATVLAHLGFWDRRGQAALRKWQRTGTQPPAADSEVLNEALEDEWQALPPRETARLATEAAERLDAFIEGLGPTMVASIQASGNTRALSRSEHRTEHLDQIERALAS